MFEVVCEHIRQQVSKGQLRPGDKLPAERDLAERLGVSRTAVREALRTLEASGVMEFRNGVHGGAFIRDVSASGIRAAISDILSLGNTSLEHLSETRTSLLTFAARLACERGLESDFDLLEANVERTALLGDGHDLNAMINAVTEFYVLLGNASHNGVQKILIEAVTDVAHELLLKLRPPNTANLVKTRRRIVAAVKDRNSEKAIRLMGLHMAELHQYVVEHGGAKILRS